MSVCCECCVLSGRGLCDGLITRPEESYRLWRVVVCDQETSNEEAKACYGVVENTTKRIVTPRKQQQTNALRYIYLWFVGPCCFITVMSVRKFFPQTRGSRTRNPICQWRACISYFAFVTIPLFPFQYSLTTLWKIETSFTFSIIKTWFM